MWHQLTYLSYEHLGLERTNGSSQLPRHVQLPCIQVENTFKKQGTRSPNILSATNYQTTASK